MSTEIGKYIKELRGSKSLRQMERDTGISHTYLSSVEKGRDPRSKKELIPPPPTLKKIAEGAGGDYIEMLKIAGYINNYIDEQLTRIEDNAREQHQEGSNNVDGFNLSLIDDAIEKLNDAVRHQKEIIRDNKKVDFKDAAFLNGLYQTIKEMDIDAFSEKDRQHLRGIIFLLLSDARDVDINDIHKQIIESEPKNKGD